MSNIAIISTDTTSDSSNVNRPVTSKPRGICAYYKTDRGCYQGDKCKFLHGESERLTPFDKSKICRFYAAGFCRRGDQCWFKHVDSATPGSSSREPPSDPHEEEYLCSICYDKPTTYGLLVGCSHIFCLQCIKNWRGSQGKSSDMVEAGTTKTCPMCRISSRFVVPSSLFLAEGDPKKAESIEKYKASMARVKCRYFKRSRPQRRFCPFGRDCFYKHENADGTPYVFDHGADFYMEQRRSRSEANDFVWEQGDSSGFEAMLNTITRVFSNAHISSSEMQRAVLSSVAAVFGADTLPPMYRLDEEDEDEEDVVNVVATESTGDESTTEQVPPLSQPWNDWLAEPYVTIPSQEDVVLDDDVSEIPGLGIFSGMSGLPPAVGSPVSVAASTLDPTVFVPSHVDNLRPLPPGPETDAAQFERLFRELEEDYRSGQGHALADAEASSSPRQLDGPQARPSDEVPVHDADPPFMTDGRGRVVWSSTSSSRSRGRGRAVSSSATILPHTKSTIDITPAEESSEGQSQRDTEDSRLPSSSRSLVRRQSVPLLVSDAGAGAEFVTDGRGGVVFASNNH